MAKGSGKDQRETFAVDRIRFKVRGTNPPVAPPKNHCDLYFLDGKLFKIDGGTGNAGPIGGVGVSASPSPTFTRKGNVGSGFYLHLGVVPSNKTGFLVRFTMPVVRELQFANSQASTCTLQLQEHDGSTFTDLETVSLTAQRSNSVTLSKPITQGLELAVKVLSGSCKDPVVGVILDGVF